MTAIQSPSVDVAELPEVLYKYLPAERIDLLEGMAVRFGRPSDFNDTFDTHYLVPRAQGTKGLTARHLFKDRLGIFCLTEKPDNHLMWVHYAGHHTGFIIGLNARAPFFREAGRILRRVTYKDRPDVLPEPALMACFCKSSEWEYEREWRCVREFQPSDPRMVRIDPSLITHIIFGSQMEPRHVVRIMQCLTDLEMMGMKFLFSAPSKKSWSFANQAKKISLCRSCGGNGYQIEKSYY